MQNRYCAKSIGRHKIMINAESILALLASKNYQVQSKDFDRLYNNISSSKGISPFEQLSQILSGLEINTAIVKQGPVEDAPPEAFPALIFFEQKWMIIDVTDDGEFKISSNGRLMHTFETVAQIPTSIAIWFEMQIAQQATITHDSTPSKNLFGIIKRLVFRKSRWVFDIIVATILVNIFAVVSSMFAMQVYDRVVPTLAFQTLYSLVIGVSIIYSTDFLLKITRSRLLDKKSSQIDKELADKVYSHLLSARIDMLPNQLGTLTAQISGIDSVRQFFTSSIVFALVDLPFSIFFLVTIYFIGGPIAGAYLAFFIISLFIGLIAQKRSQLLIKKLTMRSNEKMGVLVDSIRGLETIKVNGYERHLQQSWNNINQSVSEYSLAQKHISNFATTVSQSLGSFSYAAAIMIGVHQIEAGNMTMGAMIACSILGGRVLGPVGQAVSYLIQFETVQQSADLVNKFLEVPVERNDEKSFVFPTTKPKSIEFMDVQYAYEGAQINQVDIPNFTVGSGERVAILGKIGSGKSTLLKMLAGLYKPSQGLIKFDSAEIWSLDKRYLNRHIGYLPQQAELFKGTLLDNISMNRKISDTRILNIVNKLELDQITDRNEKGLDLPINEGGSGLSGGQRQMVALARIFAQAPSIWLLDEPTSSIDQELQKVFKEQLASELSDTDVLVFSTHNPKLAMELATRIIIMDGGKIIKDVPTSRVELRQPKVA